MKKSGVELKKRLTQAEDENMFLREKIASIKKLFGEKVDMIDRL